MRADKYWNKILDFFGLKDGIEVDEEENTLNNSALKNKGKMKNKGESKIVSINRNQELKLIFHKPESYDEVKAIVDDLRARKPVILNLENVDVDIARRFIDFVSGAIYGLNGNIQKVGSGVFVFTPDNIDIDGTKLEDTINKFLSK